MKVSLIVDGSDHPFPAGFVRLDEERDEGHRVDLIEVAFADEVGDGEVEVRIHGRGEFIVEGELVSAFDM